MAQEIIKGRLDGIRYQGDNYWTVASLRTDRGVDVVIVGNLLTVSPGDSLKLSGEWKNHPTFGRQFQFSSFEVLAPSTNEGVIGFLESKLSDIGRNRAIEMVKHFGADKVFEILANEPDRLVEISGVTPERAKQIHADYLKIQSTREVVVFLKQFRLTDNQAAKIFKRYGMRVREVLKEDPYQLIDDIDGFGFKTVDELARRMGVDHNGLSRAKAGCIYLLQVAEDKGNIFVPKESFRRQVVKELAIAPKLADEAVKLLVEKGSVILEKDRIYSARLHQVEQAVADKLAVLATSKAEPSDESHSHKQPETDHARAQ